MAQQIKRKFILNDSINEEKILIGNNGAIRARNAADSADVSLLKLDGSDKLQFLILPQVSSDPVAGNDLVRKSHLDTELADAAADVTALEGRVTAIEDDYGVAGGLATLDGSGLVPSTQLPSYVDDVLEYANLAAFPATGETGKIYVAIDTSKCYRWSGSTYIQITSGAVDSVNGQTGIVVLDTEDVAESGDSRYYTAARQVSIEAYADQAEADAITAANAYTDAEVALLEAEDLTFLKLDGSRPMTGSLEMNGNTIDGVPNINAPALGSLSISSLDGSIILDPSVSVSVSSKKIVSLADPTDAQDAATKAYVDAEVAVVAGDLAQEVIDRAADVDAEEARALAAEGVLAGDITALEAASLQWQPVEKFTLSAGDITNGYVTLSFLAVEHSIMASVDRLMIHHTDDYTVSVVGGFTRLTFAGSLITVGQEKLSAGDVIRVQACKVAIV
jgi:hypothetical protein